MVHRTGVMPGQRLVPTARGLLLACHPVPSVAVTAFATGLALLAAVAPARVVLLAGAVLCGQLSIGWSNDRFDAERDARVGRSDKPMALALADRPGADGATTGRAAVGSAVVDPAIGLALAATVALSLTLGPRAALAHLAAVGCGWAYNLGLKATWLSWVPFAVAFGLLPAVATLAAPRPHLPGAWLVGAGACLGVVAHLANALPDAADDELTGVRGAVIRLGARRAVIVSSVLLLTATALAVLGPRGEPGVLGWAGLIAGAALAVAGCGRASAHPHGRATFLGLIGFVAVLLLMLGLTSDRLR